MANPSEYWEAPDIELPELELPDAAGAYYGVAPEPAGTVHPAVSFGQRNTPLDEQPRPYQPNPGLPGYNPNPGDPISARPPVAPNPGIRGSELALLNGGLPGLVASTPAAAAAPAQPGGVPSGPGGPTPEDEAAFQAAMARMEGPQRAPARRGAGAGGPPGKSALGKAQDALVGTFDEQKDAARRLATAQADAAHIAGEKQAELARREQEDASIANLEREHADEEFAREMGNVRAELAAVKAKKIDTTRVTNDLGFFAVIGGLFGGLYMGLTKGTVNPFLADLDRVIQRDIDAQQKEIDNGRAGVTDRMNLLSQMRASHRESLTARMQTQALYYEAAKEQIAAEAQRDGGEVTKAQGDMAIGEIDQKQKALLVDIEKQKAAMAAAAAAKATARQKEVRDTWRAVHDKAIGEGMPANVARVVADNAVSKLYLGGAGMQQEPSQGEGGLLMNKRDQSHVAREQHEAQKSLDAQLSAIDSFNERRKDVAAGSAIGEGWSKVPIVGSLGPAKKNVTSRDEYNAMVDVVFDETLRAAQGAAPTESQKQAAKRFYAASNDESDDIARKQAALKSWAVQTARGKGAQASTPAEAKADLGLKDMER